MDQTGNFLKSDFLENRKIEMNNELLQFFSSLKITKSFSVNFFIVKDFSAFQRKRQFES